MNIVIRNENHRITDSLNIEIIKTLDGIFTKSDIDNELINFYYNKVIIDITAIKNYYTIDSVLEFLKAFESNKIIILLNDSDLVNSNQFLGVLVKNGYYDFTRNAAGINYLLNNPNQYNDVEHFTKDKVAMHHEVPHSNNGISSDYNVPSVEREVKKEQSGRSFKKTNSKRKIIGVENLTDHSGATTLCYSMVKQLRFNYKVKGIEMNKQDFIYFRDSDLSLCTSIDDLKLKFKEYSDVDAIIIDLNGFDATEYCDEILYLIDPGVIKLNKLMKREPNLKIKIGSGKVILNRSSIKNEDIADFEYETKLKVFHNLVNYNDRLERIQIIDILLHKLGFLKQTANLVSFFGNLFKK